MRYAEVTKICEATKITSRYLVLIDYVLNLFAVGCACSHRRTIYKATGRSRLLLERLRPQWTYVYQIRIGFLLLILATQ